MGVCPRYGAPGCGPACCLATAEQFASYATNQPEFQAYCPLVARYGESWLANDRPTTTIHPAAGAASV